MSILPVGTIIPFAGTGNIPTGFLLCDEWTNYKASDYPNLYAVIGRTYSDSDVPSGYFRTPNLVGKFIEGSTTSDTGKKMSAGLPNIKGTGLKFNGELWTPTGGETKHNNGAIVKGKSCGETARTGTNEDDGGAYCGWDFDASKYNSIYGSSDTVQPPAILMRYIIKY